MAAPCGHRPARPATCPACDALQPCVRAQGDQEAYWEAIRRVAERARRGPLEGPVDIVTPAMRSDITRKGDVR